MAQVWRPLLTENRYRSLAQTTAQFVADKIAQPFAPIAQKAKQPGIDKVGQKNAVAGTHFRPDGISRMPTVAAHRERVAGVRRKQHLLPLRQRAIREFFVKDGADMGDRTIARQI